MWRCQCKYKQSESRVKPVSKNKTTIRRETGVSRHHAGPTEGPPETPVHHNTIILRKWKCSFLNVQWFTVCIPGEIPATYSPEGLMNIHLHSSLMYNVNNVFMYNVFMYMYYV